MPKFWLSFNIKKLPSFVTVFIKNSAKSYICIHFYPGTNVPGYYISPFQGFEKYEIWKRKHWNCHAVASFGEFYANFVRKKI